MGGASPSQRLHTTEIHRFQRGILNAWLTVRIRLIHTDHEYINSIKYINIYFIPIQSTRRFVHLLIRSECNWNCYVIVPVYCCWQLSYSFLTCQNAVKVIDSYWMF